MANRVHELRWQKMMTVTELAKKSGLARATVWAIENNVERGYNLSTLVKLAKALDTPVNELFDLEALNQ